MSDENSFEVKRRVNSPILSPSLDEKYLWNISPIKFARIHRQRIGNRETITRRSKGLLVSLPLSPRTSNYPKRRLMQQPRDSQHERNSLFLPRDRFRINAQLVAGIVATVCSVQSARMNYLEKWGSRGGGGRAARGRSTFQNQLSTPISPPPPPLSLNSN